jgi:hypothetical protein
MQERICELIRQGNYSGTAALLSGVGSRTFYRWMAQGRKAKSGAFRQFWQAIKKAEAEAECAFVAGIHRASKTTWQAAAWWLERRYPLRWGKREQEQLAELARKLKALERQIERQTPPAAWCGPDAADAG